jgi:putative tricarboxylic transport membrane protein
MKKEFLAAGFWLLFSAYASVEALRLGLGSGNKPGPGVFPFGAAIAIGIIALWLLLKSRGETPSTNMAGGFATKETNKILWAVGGLVAYALLLESLGFLLCTFILIALFLKAVAGRSWLMTLSFALSVTLTAHLIFNLALRAQLPSGVLTF